MKANNKTVDGFLRIARRLNPSIIPDYPMCKMILESDTYKYVGKYRTYPEYDVIEIGGHRMSVGIRRKNWIALGCCPGIGEGEKGFYYKVQKMKYLSEFLCLYPRLAKWDTRHMVQIKDHQIIFPRKKRQ